MNKKVLLLFYPSTVPQGHQRFSMPYSLLYLERVVRDLDLEIIIISEDITPDYQQEIENYSDRLLFACVSTITGHQLKGAIKFSKFVRNNYNHAKIIWGGWHPSVLPLETIKEDYIDFVISGQGELAFRELIEALLKQQDHTEIKGLFYKKDKRIFSKPRDNFYDNTVLPPINIDLIDVSKYVVSGTLVYFASHGCVYECGFCAMSTMYKKKWFPKPVEVVVKELTYLKSKTGFKYINFQDDNFFVNKKHTISLCEALIEANLDFEFIPSGHAKNLLTYTDEDFKTIFKAGCRKVYIGAESGSQEVLDLINKKETIEDNFAVLKLLKKHAIITVFSTMVCLPSNPETDLNQTLDMIRKAKLIDSRLEILIFYYTPFPQTPLYETALKNGFIPPSNLDEWSYYTMFNSHLPWHKKHFKKRLEYFYNYYFPFYNKSIVQIAPNELKSKVRIFQKLFLSLNRWRFKKNFFHCPFEAIAMLYFVKRYNKKNNARFCFSETWSFFENRYF